MITRIFFISTLSIRLLQPIQTEEIERKDFQHNEFPNVKGIAFFVVGTQQLLTAAK
jgi:hypothetical protein